MNKKGVTAIFLFQMFIIFCILGLALAKPILDVVDDSKGINGLDCDNAQTYQDNANCTSTDVLGYFFIGITFGLAGVLITALRG